MPMGSRWASIAGAVGVAVVTLSTMAAGYPVYLAAEVAHALDRRDEFIEAVAAPGDVSTTGFSTAEQFTALRDYLKKHHRKLKRDPWYCLYSGISLVGQDEKASRSWFSQALRYSDQDAAVVWLLYNEFERYGQVEYADSALVALHKQMLTDGAVSSTLVSQQLMFEAVFMGRSAQAPEARKYWQWVGTLGPDVLWKHLWELRHSLTSSPGAAAASVSALVRIVKGSWYHQLGLYHYALSWLFRFVQVLTVGVFLAVFLKYFSHAIHPYVEMFPQAVPVSLRAMLVAFGVISLLVFGTIPLIWVLAFVLWPAMLKRERLFAGACLVCITLSPVGARTEATLRFARSPEGTPSLFTKALQEGHYPSLHARLVENAKHNKSDPLALMALALSAYKADSLQTALKYTSAALKLSPNDPVAINLSGILEYQLGHKARAREAFDQSMRRHPMFASGYFNTGKVLLDALEALPGADNINRATKLGGHTVKEFIRINDDLFGEKWPSTREFLLEDLPPKFFWDNYYPQYRADWEQAGLLWGATFLGLPPLWSQIAFIVLFLALMSYAGMLNAGRRARARKVMTCELCRAPMCKRCSKGPYCTTCYERLGSIASEGKRQSEKVRLHIRVRQRDTVTAGMLDILFPGVGMLYDRNGQHTVGLLFIPVTALAYGLLIALASFTYAYPEWIAEGLYTPFYVVTGVYVLAFLIRGLSLGRRMRSSQEK